MTQPEDSTEALEARVKHLERIMLKLGDALEAKEAAHRREMKMAHGYNITRSLVDDVLEEIQKLRPKPKKSQ